jgi:hypothetical protein
MLCQPVNFSHLMRLGCIQRRRKVVSLFEVAKSYK